MKQSHSVDIWLTKLSDVDEHMQRAYERLLNPAEKAILSRYVASHAREQYVVARALLRSALSKYADVSPDAWDFGRNFYGKPHIVAPDTGHLLKFNISHTNGVVACAINRGQELGIDVEYIDGKHDYAELTHLVLAEAELATLNRLPLCERRERFYVLWTLKEAYLKAIGIGLSIPLTSLEFDTAQRPICVKPTSGAPANFNQWHFESIMPAAKHVMALAIAIPPELPVQVNMHWSVPLA